MKKIVIVDYDCGNLLSIKRAIEKVGYISIISRDLKELQKSSHIILPGVGAFGNAISLLKKHKLIEIIKNHSLVEKKPLLGICLGMQLLLSNSNEFGFSNGLNIIEGSVEKITDQTKKKIKVPHIGWNTLKFSEKNSNFFMDKYNSFYFIHSFMVKPKDQKVIKAYINFQNIKIPAIIRKENIIGFQFHPEKSASSGLELMQRFCKND